MVLENVIFQLGILLVLAMVLGEITSRLGVSALVGQILAGIIAGPMLGLVHPNPALEFFSFLGLTILVFLIGLETKIEEIRKDIYIGIVLAASGALLTVIGGYLLGQLLFGNFNTSLAIGVAMISTSTAVPIKILIDRKEYHTHTGRIFVIMAIADDVIAILALSLLVSYVSVGHISLTYVTSLFLAIMGFIFFILTFGDKVINKFINFIQRSHDPETLFTIPLSIAFLISIWGENIGLAAITGAFIAGMAMSRSYFRESIIQPKMKILGFGLVIPIFFAYSSIFVDLSAFFTSWHLILIILIVGILTKAIGSGFMARYFGFDGKSQTIISIGMIPRGEYGIVISQIALTAGIITNQIYTILISFILLTVILTPIFFGIEKKISKGY
ncbi:MAG: cation:proton antiporter [Candidatus Aenigmarchaeota archaeon]|nr:cation:proton antiporter [Candidatus Aenigmarchaeota archaeon]